MKVVVLSLLASLALLDLAHAHGDHVAQEMTQAAQNLLDALTPEQKAKAQFTFDDAERKNWHFIPRVRKGLPLKEMTSGQRLLAQGLLATGLSSQGYTKALGIMSLEEVLAELEKGKGPVRDPDNYFVSIFGQPGPTEPWGWRVEGHHLSLNFGAGNGEVLSMTPSFFGTNPGQVLDGPRAKTRFLAQEEDLGLALVQTLTDEQRQQAIIMPQAPKDIVNVPGRNEWTNPDGLPQSKLKPEQQKALADLIHLYLDRHRSESASEEWAKVEKAGVDKIVFAWAGETELGKPHYYRVQGPTFVLEFDNTQNQANHVHSVWRGFDHDFGDDLLKKHYEQSHATPTATPKAP